MPPRTCTRLRNRLKRLNRDLAGYISRSIEHALDSEGWFRLTQEFKPRPCWKMMNCRNAACPMHQKTASRCWLEAGTLCSGGKPCGDFVEKYKSCLQCKVFKSVGADPVRELYENISILIHHLNERAVRLHRLAIRDPLTNLYNRRFFNEIVPREMAEAEREQKTLTLLVMDLDHFKQINDRHGHGAGDDALAAAAKVLRSVVRTTDLIFRVGGDEFLIILLHRQSQAPAYLAKRLQRALAAWNQRHVKKNLPLSMSMGWASWEPGLSIKEVLAAADRAMYREKEEKKLKSRAAAPTRKATTAPSRTPSARNPRRLSLE